VRLADVTIEGTVVGRDGWTFPYRTEELARAAAAKAKFHRERFEHYRVPAEAAEAELRSKGMELREHQVTGGAQFQGVVDPALAAKLTDLRTRRDSHETSAKTFETYAGAFGALTDRSLHLTINDVAYFGLHEPEPRP
jgi:hypothetical protein